MSIVIGLSSYGILMLHLLNTTYDIPPEVVNILDRVCVVYAVDRASILGGRKYPAVARARGIAMYLCCKFTKLSLPEIGRALGGRHHTTVLAARDKWAALIKDDYNVRSEIFSIMEQLKCE
jgi:chromosomal replication initiator protein